jgi:hypothetical protein
MSLYIPYMHVDIIFGTRREVVSTWIYAYVRSVWITAHTSTKEEGSTRATGRPLISPSSQSHFLSCFLRCISLATTRTKPTNVGHDQPATRLNILIDVKAKHEPQSSLFGDPSNLQGHLHTGRRWCIIHCGWLSLATLVHAVLEASECDIES